MTSRAHPFAATIGALALIGVLAACNSGGVVGDAGTDSGGSTTPTCASYCATITANCTLANRQYGGTETDAMSGCMAACNADGWSVGTSADTSGNTLGCRTYHATAAAGDPATHCPHAGPLGGGVCGASQCADFCAADVAVCGTTAYANMAACMTACTAFTDAAANIASPTTTSGNTLSCRAYHLSAAATDATTHCPHTSMSGGGVCM